MRKDYKLDKKSLKNHFKSCLCINDFQKDIVRSSCFQHKNSIDCESELVPFRELELETLRELEREFLKESLKASFKESLRESS